MGKLLEELDKILDESFLDVILQKMADEAHIEGKTNKMKWKDVVNHLKANKVVPSDVTPDNPLFKRMIIGRLKTYKINVEE